MIKPKVSVIIPVYNTEKYLRECLDSVINQTLKDIEIICVNDGSTDNSINILNEYKQNDSRIKVLNIKNSGPSIARNLGLNIANGSLIYFLDSDDFIEPNLLNYAVKIFETFDVDYFCFSSSVLVDENCQRKSFSKGIDEYINAKRDGFYNLDFETCLNTNIHIWNKVFKLEHLNKYNIRFPENLLYEDIYFTWLYFLTSSKAYYDDSIYHYYRISSHSIMEKQINSKEFSNGFQHMENWYSLFKYLTKYPNLFIKNSDNLKILLGYYVMKAKEYCKPEDKYKIEKIKLDYLSELEKLYQQKRKQCYFSINILGIKIKIRKNNGKTFILNTPITSSLSNKSEVVFKKAKKLSIITICYNELNLEQTCESIVNQTWQDFEWIVIDGGSNKETQKIWNKYKYRIDKFISEPDNGIYDACNKGIKLATGDYLNFMNAGDCYYNNNVLSNIASLFNKNNEILYGNSFYIFPSEPEKNILKEFPNKINKFFFFFDNLNTQAVFVKRTLFEKYGCFNTSYHICADWEKWLTFIKNNKHFINIPITIAKYNMEGLSNSVNYKNELENIKKQYFSSREIYKLKNNVYIETYKPIEQLFSIKNSSNKKHKILTIFGIHIKIKKRGIK